MAAGTIIVGGMELFAETCDLFGGIGQALEFVQGEKHHVEDVKYNRINLHQDMQSLRLDALDHGKEEIRENYDMYVGRIESLLLVLALIWPFALSTIQFSDPFVPVGDDEDCPDCIEKQFTILVHVWVFLIALVLVLPFWGILCLIRVKLALDAWLEDSLASLKVVRKDVVKQMENDYIDDTKLQKADQVVMDLVNDVSESQDKLSKLWSRECSRSVHIANVLLWISAYMALCLSGLSVWIYLWNKGGAHRIGSHILGTVVFVLGCGAPVAYWAYYVVYLKGREAEGEETPPPWRRTRTRFDDSRGRPPLADARRERLPSEGSRASAASRRPGRPPPGRATSR